MAKGNFSEKEKEFIKNNKGSKFIRQMASELGRSVFGVKKVIRKLEEGRS